MGVFACACVSRCRCVGLVSGCVDKCVSVGE